MKIFPLASAVFSVALLAACTVSNVRDTDIVTKAKQDAATPDWVLAKLKLGNEHFAAGRHDYDDHLVKASATAKGQYPKAIVLSCLDSRVPTETIFNQGIGDLFVARVAGNIDDDHMVGSFEFGSAVAGAKAIVVLGHTSCGAMKHAIDKTDAKGGGMFCLGRLLDAIEPAVVAAIAPGQKRDSHDHALLEAVIEKNVQLTIESIRRKSPVLARLEKDGKLKFAGGVYDLATGKVKWLKP